MLICYLCSHCAFKIDDLLLHRTEFHALNSFSTFKYTYCVRKNFNNKSTFKKHLLNHHRDFEENIMSSEHTQSQNTILDISNYSQASFSFEESFETERINNHENFENTPDC